MIATFTAVATAVVLLSLAMTGAAHAAGEQKAQAAGDHRHKHDHSGCPIHGEREGRAPEQMLQQFKDEFGLTGQQQTDIQIIVSDYGERLRDIARLGRKSAEDLLATDPEDPAYRKTTDDAAALAANSAAETVVLLAEMRAKLHAVLTPEQREMLRQKIDEKRAEFEQKKRQRKMDGESHDRPMGQFIG
jgi:Spy/CpxP family protein refolding chaperone